MTNPKLLVIDANTETRASLKSAFEKVGYDVITAQDGAGGLEAARIDKPNIVLLDIELPGISGLDVCRDLHKEFGMPMLVLSAKNTEIDRVLAIELGADDYVTKPFSMREVVLRIRSILNRSLKSDSIPTVETVSRPGVVTIDDLELDLNRHRFFCNGKEIYLTLKEFELLAFMMENRGEVFSRDSLLDKVWGYEHAIGTRTIDYLVCGLRSKIEDNPKKPQRFKTVRGVGYKLE